METYFALFLDFRTVWILSRYLRYITLVIGSDVIDEDTLEDNPNDKVYELKYHVANQETFIPNVFEYKKTLESYPIHKIIPESS